MYNVINVNPEDINLIKNVYKNGEENMGDYEENLFNKRIDKNTYNSKLISSETFFCDTRNKALINVIKKYISLKEILLFIIL